MIDRTKPGRLAFEKIEKRAAHALRRDPTLSPREAVAKVFTDEPHLLEQHSDEVRRDITGRQDAS